MTDAVDDVEREESMASIYLEDVHPPALSSQAFIFSPNTFFLIIFVIVPCVLKHSLSFPSLFSLC